MGWGLEATFILLKLEVLMKRPKEIESDPLKRAEQLLHEFDTAAGAALVKLNNTIGSTNIDSALSEAAEIYRRGYAFSHALFQATGRTIYRRPWNFPEQLTEYQRQRWTGIKRNSMPSAVLPDEAKEILEQLKAVKPPSKIFEGENEWQEDLRKRGLVEADPPDAPTRTRRPTGPSIE
jgi:hypothetical protein